VTYLTHKFPSEPTFVIRMTTTYTLTLTPPDGPKSKHHGLSREQALWALTDLMYGDALDTGEKLDRDARHEEPLAA
jgi:hypothetical protein